MDPKDKASLPASTAQKARVLLLPGWLDSDATHWQSRWQHQHGYTRVVQDDWLWPKRGDWMARLEDTLLDDGALVVSGHTMPEGRDQAMLGGHEQTMPAGDDQMPPVRQAAPPTILVAHSLGTHLVAAWAAHSKHTHLVAGALLVAPPDVERGDMPPNFSSWCPIVRQRLPFPALTVVSSDDPYATLDVATGMAKDWGTALVNIGPCGHINGASGLGNWDAGHQWMLELLQPVGLGS
jgi:uncharacterized protein